MKNGDKDDIAVGRDLFNTCRSGSSIGAAYLPSQGVGLLSNSTSCGSTVELLYFLIWRDIKVRYKQTVLGVAWAILSAFFTMVVFSLFFGRLAKMPSDGVPYPIFSYAALVPWTFFANGLSKSSSSMVGSANLIKRSTFPGS